MSIETGSAARELSEPLKRDFADCQLSNIFNIEPEVAT